MLRFDHIVSGQVKTSLLSNLKKNCFEWEIIKLAQTANATFQLYTLINVFNHMLIDRAEISDLWVIVFNNLMLYCLKLL